MTVTTTATAAGPDLDGFLMAHRGFRAEFARLAKAAAEVRDQRHAALIEDQIDLVMHVLHHHHTAEDTTIWPTLVRRAPGAEPVLARLEAQHEEMDPLFSAITDRTRPVSSRADDLQSLHELLNAHLDEEEREALPLIRAHYPAAEWDAEGKRVQETLERKKMPLVFGWLGSASAKEQVDAALAGVPLLPRTLYRLMWAPAYRRRFLALYGPNPAVPMP